MHSKKIGRNSDIVDVVVVMGLIGAGKSTFINTAAHDAVISVSHDYETTEDIHTASVRHPHNASRTVIFVEPPGFNHTNLALNDLEILKRVADWLARSLNSGMKCAGIIYLHDISSHCMLPESPMKIFGQLCANSAAKTVTLATTKWSKTPRDEGQKQLADKWINMLGKGSHIAPFMDTHESAWDIVNLIIENEPFDAVLFQKLVDHQKHPPKPQRPRGFFRSLFGGLFG